MALIYSGKGTTEASIAEPSQTIDMSGINKQADAMKNAMDKQIETYNKQQLMNGENAISLAYEQHKDDPEKYKEAVTKSLGAIESVLPSDEEKIAFKAGINDRVNLYDARVKGDFAVKQDKMANETDRIDAQTTMTEMLSKIDLMWTSTDPKVIASFNSQIGKLVALSEKRDRNGNFILSDAMIAKVNDIKDNPKFYGALSQATYLQSIGDKTGLDAKYTELTANPEATMKKYGLDKVSYSQMVSAFKKEVSPREVIGQRMNEMELGIRIKSLDIGYLKDDKGRIGLNVRNDRVKALPELYSIQEDLDAQKNAGLISDKYYRDNSLIIKSTIYNMQARGAELYPSAKRDWLHWMPTDSVGAKVMKTVEAVMKDMPVNTENDALRYDMTKIAIDYFKKQGKDPNSIENIDIAPIKGEIIRRAFPNATDEDLKTEKSQTAFLARKGEEIATKEVKDGIGLISNPKIDGFAPDKKDVDEEKKKQEAKAKAKAQADEKKNKLKADLKAKLKGGLIG